MPITTIVRIVSAASITLLLAAGAIVSDPDQALRWERLHRATATLEHTLAQRRAEVALSASRALSHFDDIEILRASLEAHKKAMLDAHAPLEGESIDVDVEIKAFMTGIEGIEQHIERFKETYAATRNSRAYLSDVTPEVVAVTERSGHPEIAQAAQQLSLSLRALQAHPTSARQSYASQTYRTLIRTAEASELTAREKSALRRLTEHAALLIEKEIAVEDTLIKATAVNDRTSPARLLTYVAAHAASAEHMLHTARGALAAALALAALWGVAALLAPPAAPGAVSLTPMRTRERFILAMIGTAVATLANRADAAGHPLARTARQVGMRLQRFGKSWGDTLVRETPETVDLEAAIDRVAAGLAPTCPRAAIEREPCDPGSISSRLGPHEIELLLVEALTNALQAIEASDNGHHVQIFTRRDPGSRSAIEIVVRDSATGAAALDPEAAMEMFVTSDPSRIGAGLRLMQVVTARVGGTAEWVPRATGGSETVIRLPDETRAPYRYSSSGIGG